MTAVLLGLLIPCALISPNTALPVLLVLLALFSWDKKALQSSDKGILAFLGLFVLWGALSSLWSLDPKNSLLTSLKLAGLLMVGLIWISRGQRGQVTESHMKALLLGYVLIGGFLIIDWLRHFAFVTWWGVNHAKLYGPVGLVMLISFFPLSHWLWRTYGMGASAIFTLFSGFAFLSVEIELPLMALIFVSALVIVFYPLSARAFYVFMAGAGVLKILLAPWLLAYVMTPHTISWINHYFHNFSYIHRLHIWHVLGKKILEAPWLGHGLNSGTLAQIRPESYEWSFETAPGQFEAVVQKIPDSPLFFHPHNVVVQTWYELGWIGAALVAGILVWVLRQMSCQPKADRAFSFGFLMCLLLVGVISTSAWQTWWLASALIVVGVKDES